MERSIRVAETITSSSQVGIYWMFFFGFSKSAIRVTSFIWTQQQNTVVSDSANNVRIKSRQIHKVNLVKNIKQSLQTDEYIKLAGSRKLFVSRR